MKRFKRLFVFSLLCLFLWIGSAISYAADEPALKWDASTGEVIGYIVYYGITEGVYAFNENVGNVTEVPNLITALKLNPDTKYWFAIRAYNEGGESGLSNVTTYTTPGTPSWEPPENSNPILTPPVVIEVPGSVRQLIINFSVPIDG